MVWVFFVLTKNRQIPDGQEMSERLMSDETSDGSVPSDGHEDDKGKDFLTPVEVAEGLRVSKMTVYRMLSSGVIRAIRVGRVYRIPRSAYDDYLKEASLRGASYVPPVRPAADGE